MRAFISYSHKDSGALERLHTHLAILKREGKITEWFDREILAGSDIDKDVEAALTGSDLFLALVSPDFLASHYCYEREMTEAIRRHDAGTMRVVPIILEPCEWKSTPLRKLKAVPRDGTPVSEWTNANSAFLDVVTELRRIAEAAVQAAAPPRMVEVTASAIGEPRRYRVKRDFDEIDRGDFRTASFETIRDYFQKSVAEIDGVDSIRARFRLLGALGFTCTVINQARQRGAAHLTVHANSGRAVLGDITFTHDEGGEPNRANGMFSIEADEYELFLTGGTLMSNQKQKLTSQQVAKTLWTDLLERAGITHA